MLLARGRNPLSVRKIRRMKYSVSTGMIHVQTKLINYYYYSPFPKPSPLPILVSVWLLHCTELNPSLLTHYVFSVESLKAIFTTIKMPLVQTNGASTIVARERTWDNEHPMPARYATYWSLAHKERKISTKVERVGHGPGRLGRRRSPRLRSVLCRRRYDVARN